MDTTRDIIYRDFLINDSSVSANVDSTDGLAKGITGCVVDEEIGRASCRERVWIPV